MTIKEIAKLLCILSGYDTNMSFESWYTDDVTCKGYDMYAEDDNGYCINVQAAMGSIDLIQSILDEIKENPKHNAEYWCKDVPYKVLLNDEWRQLRKEKDSLYKHHVVDILALEKPLFEYHKENNPCPNCTINTKEHWDDIHYNCEAHHTMSCPILKKYHQNSDKVASEIRNSSEYKKMKEEYHKKDNEINEQLNKIYNKIMKKD